MDIKKTKRLLKKINKLHDVWAEGSETHSVIEKDLLLSYIRDLYELILFEKGEKISHHDSKPDSNSVKPVHSTHTSEIIEKSETLTASLSDEKVSLSLPVDITQEKVDIDPEIEKLFEIKEIKELSDRLSMTPVQDLNRAIGINDKISNIRDLFGGDHNLYEKIISDLNSLKQFEEATQYLKTEIAIKQEWEKENKREKARNFIKIVKRRYL